MYMAGMPYHVVQRGNNREACFFEVEDCQLYLDLLATLSQRYHVQVHAYVLMTNHIHCLLTPQEDDGISRLTGVLGSRFAQCMNKKYKRTGTLWEGRHKSSVIDSENYLLACYRYIELNPVRAGMVTAPEEYEWSSYRVNAWGDSSNFIMPHDELKKLSVHDEERFRLYRQLFAEGLEDKTIEQFRKATHYCQPVGDKRFRDQIERQLGRKIGQARRGRPQKKVVSK